MESFDLAFASRAAHGEINRIRIKMEDNIKKLSRLSTQVSLSLMSSFASAPPLVY